MIRRPPRSTRVRSSAASDVYKRQCLTMYIREKICPRLRIPLRRMGLDFNSVHLRSLGFVSVAVASLWRQPVPVLGMRLYFHSSSGQFERKSRFENNRSGPVAELGHGPLATIDGLLQTLPPTITNALATPQRHRRPLPVPLASAGLSTREPNKMKDAVRVNLPV